MTLTEPTNRVGAFTGLSSGGNVSYVNSNALTIGALPLQQLAVTVSGTTGLAISSAYTLSTQSGPLAGVTAAGNGAVFLTTKTQALTLNDPLNGGTVDLTLAAGVTQVMSGIAWPTLFCPVGHCSPARSAPARCRAAAG